MSQKLGRWKLYVLILGLVAFVGIGLAPIITPIVNGVMNATQANSSNTVATPTTTTNSTTNSQQGDLEAQARGYELVVQREPNNETALRGLLETRLKLQDIPGAIAALEKLVAINPQRTDYAVLLAQGKQQIGDRDGASTVYRTILETQPGNINALQGYVNLLLMENRPEAAIGLLEDTLKTAPQANQIQPGSIDVVSVQVILGQVYADQQRYDEAIAVYDEAMKAEPEDFRPIYAKAIVWQNQGKMAEAKPLFETAAKLAPPQYRDQIQQQAQQVAPAVPATPQPEAAPQSPAPAPEVDSTPAPEADSTPAPEADSTPAPEAE
ncbi:tetratricopeptide repeat protein [Laspinema olomoucense]|uniref:tetratricopeptide repeat protein n=1 Tax=Laspinema olomoucense TaxID=3231600 RepID=UPI0021BB7AA4|nr:tetratricopeptide repeat protein [Laspinema sp. D3d]MCT7973590.1 tetratricopeptide repeat protein [Laspinema sp. D3d]